MLYATDSNIQLLTYLQKIVLTYTLNKTALIIYVFTYYFTPIIKETMLL